MGRCVEHTKGRHLCPALVMETYRECCHCSSHSSALSEMSTSEEKRCVRAKSNCLLAFSFARAFVFSSLGDPSSSIVAEGNRAVGVAREVPLVLLPPSVSGGGWQGVVLPLPSRIWPRSIPARVVIKLSPSLPVVPLLIGLELSDYVRDTPLELCHHSLLIAPGSRGSSRVDYPFVALSYQCL